MWIVYLVISIMFYSASKGAAANSSGSAVSSLVWLGILCGLIYAAIYYVSPYGKMLKAASPNIEDKYKEHRKSMHSYFSRNSSTMSLAFLVFALSNRLSDYSKTVVKSGYVYDDDFSAIVILLIGIGILLAFALKYKNLVRSEKREVEYLDEITKQRYKEAFETSAANIAKNPTLHYIEYLGGHHFFNGAPIYLSLSVDGRNLNAIKAYDNTAYFSVFIPDISEIRHDTVYSDNASTSLYDELTSTKKIMYIDYLTEDGGKHSLRFSIGKRNTLPIENRIMDIRYEYEESIKNNLDNEKQENMNAEESTINEEINLNIEDRLVKLKELWDKDLINEADYTKRKEEILKEI